MKLFPKGELTKLIASTRRETNFCSVWRAVPHTPSEHQSCSRQVFSAKIQIEEDLLPASAALFGLAIKQPHESSLR